MDALCRNARPFLPRYFKAVVAGFVPADDPMESGLVIDFVHYEHAPDRVRLEATPPLVWLLTKCDGVRQLGELLDDAHAIFPSTDLSGSEERLSSLFSHRVLLDAAEDPAAAPESSRDRYARHSLFYAAHGANATAVARALNAAKVVIVGVGGIGTWVSYLLAAAGIGQLVLIDGDVVETSNLTRQVLYSSHDIGCPKVAVAAERLRAANDSIVVTAIAEFADKGLLEAVLDRCDLIVVSGDTPDTLYEDVSLATASAKVPWIRGGYYFDVGIVGPLLIPGVTGCQKCLFGPARSSPDLPLLTDINLKYQVPSFGPLNGVVASLIAKDALMFLGGMKQFCRTIGSILAMDFMNARIETIELKRSFGPPCYCE